MFGRNFVVVITEVSLVSDLDPQGLTHGVGQPLHLLRIVTNIDGVNSNILRIYL